MRETVDYRLLERFRARRRFNLRAPEPKQAYAQQQAAWQRVRALDLRD